jgi:hypothetical protein
MPDISDSPLKIFEASSDFLLRQIFRNNRKIRMRAGVSANLVTVANQTLDIIPPHEVDRLRFQILSAKLGYGFRVCDADDACRKKKTAGNTKLAHDFRSLHIARESVVKTHRDVAVIDVTSRNSLHRFPVWQKAVFPHEIGEKFSKRLLLVSENMMEIQKLNAVPVRSAGYSREQ